jgi:hypothetical protein
LIFFDGLFDLLIDKGYFSFYETSAKYLENLIQFTENNIETFPHKKAPVYFSKYGNDLFYITYERNPQTTWYIFFEKGEDFYFIKHITNNHVSGKYF